MYIVFLVFFLPLCRYRFPPDTTSAWRNSFNIFLWIRSCSGEFIQLLNIWKTLYFTFLWNISLVNIQVCVDSFLFSVLYIYLLHCLWAHFLPNVTSHVILIFASPYVAYLFSKIFSLSGVLSILIMVCLWFSFLHDSYVYGSLNFLDLWVYDFHQI